MTPFKSGLCKLSMVFVSASSAPRHAGGDRDRLPSDSVVAVYSLGVPPNEISLQDALGMCVTFHRFSGPFSCNCFGAIWGSRSCIMLCLSAELQDCLGH